MVEDKPTYFVDVDKAPRFLQMEGVETTVLTGFHGERMMMVFNATQPGHEVPIHSHPHEQMGMVNSGEAIFKIGDEERHARQGDLYRIPANVPHGYTVLSDEPFIILDIFQPVRKDFIDICKRMEKQTE